MTGNARIKLRGDTAANWTSANPILAAREIGIETDTRKTKQGDGVNAWSALSYSYSDSLIDGKVSSATLAATGGAATVGADDGSSGSLWTTVQGFITYLKSSAGSAVLGFIQAGTGAVARTAQDKARDIVNAKDFGAKGDFNSVADGAMTAGSATLTSSTAAFTSADVGKAVQVLGAGTSGAALSSTISAYVSATQVTLAAAASTTVTSAGVCYGTDDTSAIQNAINSLGAAGGAVMMGRLKSLVLSNLTVNANVALIGTSPWTGRSTSGAGTNTNFAAMAGVRLSSSATITLNGGASLNGILVYRYGLVFPAANSSLFAGTAVTAGGDDIAVSRCFIMGFNKAILVSGVVRPRIEYVYMDNNNGVEITNCGDIPYTSHCHCWPWATIASLGVHTTIERSGIAFYVHDSVDWAKFTDCFSYGYSAGFQATNCNSTTFLSCGADNTYASGPLNTNAYGFVINGTSGETRLIGCQASASGQAGVIINTSAGLQTTVSSSNFWGLGNHGIIVSGGNANIVGNDFRNVPSGVTVASSTSRVTDGGGNVFDNTITTPWSINAATTLVRINPFNDYVTFGTGNPVGGSAAMTLPSIASADPLNIPSQGDVFNVTGTTNFGGLNGGYAGRVVTLVFGGALSVFNSTGAANAMRLAGNTTYTASANSTLTLRHNGVQWFEVGRAA